MNAPASTPIAAYRRAHCKLEKLCYYITSGHGDRIADPDIMHYNGIKPTWGDVAALLTAIERLQEISDFLNHEGEYTPPEY